MTLKNIIDNIKYKIKCIIEDIPEAGKWLEEDRKIRNVGISYFPERKKDNYAVEYMFNKILTNFDAFNTCSDLIDGITGYYNSNYIDQRTTISFKDVKEPDQKKLVDILRGMREGKIEKVKKK